MMNLLAHRFPNSDTRVTLSSRSIGILSLLVANGGLQAVAAGVIALMIGNMTDGLQVSEGPDQGVLALLFCAVALIVFLRFRETLDGERLGQGVAHETRLRLSKHLMRLPSRTRTASGDVLLRFVGDLAALRNWYAKGVVNLIVGGPVALAGIGAITFLHWPLGLALSLATALAIGVQILISARLRVAAEAARHARGRLASDVIERIDTLASVQLFGRSSAEHRRIDRRSAKLAHLMENRARWSGMLRASAEGAALLTPLLVMAFWYLSTRMEGPTLDVGAGLSAMAVGVLIASRLRGLGRVLEHWTLAQISRERIKEFLERRPLEERANDRDMNRRAGRLELKKLAVGTVFNDVTAVAEPGARIALIGANGAGKSRLLGVIAGLEEQSGGKVVIDRQDVGKRRLGSLRRLVAMASAETRLLRGTVEQNIRYGARAGEGVADRLLSLGGYDALLDDLPKGGDTRVGLGGNGLSLGQQQRIALLRALMRNPLILLLDEIDAHLDEAGQATLQRVFDEFGGTIIMATHSKDWIAKCGEAWRLDDGQLTVECGQDPKPPLETRLYG